MLHISAQAILTQASPTERRVVTRSPPGQRNPSDVPS